MGIELNVMRLPPGYTDPWGSKLKNGVLIDDYDDYLLARMYRIDKLWRKYSTCNKCGLKSTYYRYYNLRGYIITEEKLDD